MTDHFYEEKEWDDTPAYEDWHDLEHVDVEITEVHNSDWLNVRDLELEHSEFSHSHIHSEPSSELVKQHFPHLAPPPVVEEPLPILLWFGSCVGTAALVIICYELLRYCVRARETARNAKKKKSKEKEQQALTSSGPLPLIDALRTLCKVSHEMQSNNRAVQSHNSSKPSPTNSFYTKSHYYELSRLAYSLYEHVHRNFHQFEAISSDPSWLQLEMEQEAEQDSIHHHTSSRSNVNYSNGAIDVLAEVNKRIDAVIAALSPSYHIISSSAQRNNNASRKAHIEDRLSSLYAQRDLSEVKVQFSLVRDAFLKVQCVSDKGYIHDIVTRLRRAIENRNEYPLLECTVMLQELHLHHSAAFSEIHDVYCSAEAMLLEIHDQEDHNVRRTGQEKFLADQNEMIDTFQAFSPRETNTSSKKQVFLTDSAKNRPINTPIVPETKETESKETEKNINNESCGIADETSLNNDMNNLHISEPASTFEQAGIDAIDPSAPAFSLDNSCLSPPESQKYPHTITSPVSNPNDSSLTIVNTPLSPVNDTHKLISSQWAMEALRMRREAQSSVDKQLQALKEKRKDKEQLARARARRSIEEREREKRAANLFLEGLDEQRKSRQVAETEHFERQEKELQQEFAKQKEKQYKWDSRAYSLICIAAVVWYLLVYTKYNMYSGGVFGLYSWATSTLRNSCQFLACDKHLVSVRSEHTRSTNINDIAGGINNPTEPAFLPIDAPYTDYTATDTCTTDYVGKQPSLKLVSAYQSTYRTTTQYLNSLVSVPMSTYALRYALTGYIGNAGTASHPIIPGITGSGVLYEMYNGGRCVLHVMFRTLPSIMLTKVISFLGMKKLSGWAAVFFTLLCFSDILLQMAVGPLLPLLVILCLHTIIFQVITVFDEHRLRWILTFRKYGKGLDVRSIILHAIYPVVGLFVVNWCAQAPV